MNGHLHPHSLRGMTLTLFSAAELTSDVHWSPRKTLSVQKTQHHKLNTSKQEQFRIARKLTPRWTRRTTATTTATKVTDKQKQHLESSAMNADRTSAFPLFSRLARDWPPKHGADGFEGNRWRWWWWSWFLFNMILMPDDTTGHGGLGCCTDIHSNPGNDGSGASKNQR